ncbi:hypothetical protein SAMN04487894_11652 [Niabella drilacis]|uniref:Uncharacterized protein n=2 Tax=Niabella drilacis (strain DSM 25811 / CCM 8410 / CCUG 62505 / LMG 26954 / E90) TaxID=1285928 RepID=A0A1G6YRP4_NIADE|nr:hypothetical protein SAMN04487894_11652 [Niabella drilacis]
MIRTAVEVFKTNVPGPPVAKVLTIKLKALLPSAKINFDLDDCDHILRVEARRTIDVALIRNCILYHGYEAELL